MTKYILSFWVIVFLLIGCANQQPPDGGPIDMTPPQIVSVYPDSNTLEYKDHHIRLEFEQYIDERSLEESIFISPYIGDLEFDWSGRDVTISFSEKLRDNTTYVMNIGTDVRDRFRNQTRMAKAYTLAFSTGLTIDRGAMEGRIIPLKESDVASGIMIFAYQLDGINPDTLNPMRAKPDFITQSGKNGDFFLYHIPYGTYRLFAIRDQYRNLVYDQEIDDYGVPSGLIRITSTDTLASDIFMKLAKEDTTGPRLIKVSAPDRNHIIADFSESLDPFSCSLSAIVIEDTIEKKPLELLNVSPSPTVTSSYIIITQDQDSTKAYQFVVKSVTDSIGNQINSLANSLVFQGSSKIDSTRPKLASVSMKDSTKNVSVLPILTLIFSDAMERSDSSNWVNILDNQKQTIPVEKKWMGNFMISLSPKKELSGSSWYTLRSDFQGLKNWAGRVCRDSIRQWRFETLDLEEMSSAEGMVVDVNKTDTTGLLYVSALPLGGKGGDRSMAAADASGKFVLQKLVEGTYIFQAFRDRNRNGMYDAGKPFPFVYSERLSSVSDTLKIRARWPLEGVRIEMK